MTKMELMNSVTRAVHKLGFGLRKHAPTIMTVGGAVGVVVSAVGACKATTKVGALLDEAKQQIDAIHKIAEDPAKAEEYSKKDVQQALTVTYVKTGWELVKLYGPSVALGALSLGSMIGAHHINTKRNIALAAAYTAVDRGFKDYRGRVIERFGEEMDKELKYNIKTEKIKEIVVDEETGEEKEVETMVEVVDPNTHSPYSKFFDVGNPYWQKNAEQNLFFLHQQQNWANQKLQAQGYLFLNDVYEMLGMDKTAAGQQVGWIYDKHNNGEYDNFVDFGIYDADDPAKRRFVNGHERTILLDFNVDGPILHMLP